MQDQTRSCVDLVVMEDAAGYITVATSRYIHEYGDPKQAAKDAILMLGGANTSTWDGNDPEVRQILDAVEAGEDNGCTLLSFTDLQNILRRGANHSGGYALKEFIDILAHDARMLGVL